MSTKVNPIAFLCVIVCLSMIYENDAFHMHKPYIGTCYKLLQVGRLIIYQLKKTFQNSSKIVMGRQPGMMLDQWQMASGTSIGGISASGIFVITEAQ